MARKSTSTLLILFLSMTIKAHATSLICHQAQNQNTEIVQHTYTPLLRKVIESSGRSVGVKDGLKQYPVPFETRRGFLAYFSLFQKRFYEKQHPCNPHDAVLDAGCGDAYLSDFLFSEKPEDFGSSPDKLEIFRDFLQRSASNKASYIGVTFDLVRRTREFFQDRLLTSNFRLLTGRFFEDIPVSELRGNKSVRMITDYYGVLSYTARPDLVLKRYLEVLEDDGEIFVVGNMTMMVDRKYNFMGWLRQVSGIQIEYTSDPYGLSGIVIRKSAGLIQIPELRLTSTQKLDAPPPKRFFARTGAYLTVGNGDEK